MGSLSSEMVTTLQNILKQFNLDKRETAIIYVTGNDADQGIDLDNLSENYSALLNEFTAKNLSIIVSGLLPTESVNLGPYNECEAQVVDFVDHYNGFLFASGDLAESYFHSDKVHPNSPLQLRSC